MTMAALEASVCSGSPVYLYEFVSNTDTWRYTSLGRDYVFGGHTWTHLALTHGELRDSSDPSSGALSVKVPITSPVAVAHFGNPRPWKTTLTVFRTHDGDVDLEVETQWKGILVLPSIDNGVMNLQCNPIGADLDEDGLKRFVQRMCPYVLFGQGCNLVRSANAIAAYATALNGNIVTVPAVQGQSSLTLGVIECGGEYRTIVNHTGYLITMNWPMFGLAAAIAAAGVPPGAAVNLYSPCRKTTAACRARGNIGNYGGFNRMAGLNPMDGFSNVF